MARYGRAGLCKSVKTRPLLINAIVKRNQKI